MKSAVPRIHAVTDAAVAILPDLASRARALSVSPAVGLHARIPRGDGRPIFELAQWLHRAAAPTGSAVLVNDRADIARFTGARGVHLPANGLPTAVARGLVGPEALVGRSTHHPDQARRAADEGVDYVFLGPIWQTPSHRDGPALGLGALRGLSGIRVIAIGGITPERVRRCRDAGAWGVAAISALWSAGDPRAAAGEMLLSFDQD